MINRFFKIFTFLLLGCVFQAAAQTVITGTVTDIAGVAVSNASVAVVGKDSVTVLSFAISNASGHFKIPLPKPDISPLLKVSVIGYRTVFITAGNNGPVTVKLQPDVKALREVNVHPDKLLVKKGDTLSYDVSSFAKKQDRTIGDVIKNLPGVTMGANGQISYNGRPINKFYIDGDDLLDNKYNLASTTVPADAVDKVQVFENHQPIKALRGSVKSDQAALNLKLKNAAKLHVFGTGEFTGGLPRAYGGKADIMLFKDKVKFLNTAAYNNTGNDLSYNVESHTLEDLLNEFDRPLNRQMLSTRTISDPQFDRERWLFNKSALFTINNLVKLNADNSVRVNAYYRPSVFDQDYSSSIRYFLPNGNLNQSENERIHSSLGTVFASFDFQNNGSKLFIDNKLDAQLQNEHANAQLNTEAGEAMQYLKNRHDNFNNSFRLVNPLRNNLLMELSSQTGYVSHPERLTIMPGIYPTALNSDSAYASALQNIAKHAFYTKNKMSLKFGAGKFQQAYNVGYDFLHSEIDSRINTEQYTGTVSELPDMFKNATTWNNSTISAAGSFGYNLRDFQFTASLPISYQHISFSDHLHTAADSSLSAILFSPAVSIKWNLTVKQTIALRGNRSISFGEPEDILPGEIIANYRTIFNNNNVINRRESYNSNISYTFRNPINILFVTTGLTYSSITNNTITRLQFGTDGLITRNRAYFTNKANRLMLIADISKYLFDLKSTIRGGFNLSLSHQEQVQNGVLLHVVNKGLNINAEFNAKPSDRYNFNYRVDYLLANNKNKEEQINTGTTTNEVRQKLSFTLFLQRDLYFQTFNQFIILHSADVQNNIFFNDLKLSYTLPGTKTDVSLACTNTFNKKLFIAQSLDLNSSEIDVFRFRPRTVFASVRLVF